MFGEQGHRRRAQVSLEARLDRIEGLLARVLARLRITAVEEQIMNDATRAALDDLKAKVEAQTTVEQSVETALSGLSAQIKALLEGQSNQDVIDAINAAAAIVDHNNAALAAAVVANTPTA